jgi:hypothetical protein
MPPTKPKRKPGLDGQIDSVRPWDSPMFQQPLPSPMPPGVAVPAETTPPSTPSDDALSLAAQLEAIRKQFKNMVPEWLWNSPPPTKPSPPPQ